MAHCFCLVPKGQDTPISLQKVDDLMREHFQQPPDMDHFLGGWYDSIGFRLAMGRSFEDIIAEFVETVANATPGAESAWALQLLQITLWLELNYTCDSWRSANG